MLDLRKIAGQMQALSQQVQQESQQQRSRLQQAELLYQKTIANQAYYVNQHHQFRDKFPFHSAVPAEPLDRITTVDLPEQPHQVIATDGSQIAPSRHESVYCYLLNIGRVFISYHTGKVPLLDSVPAIYYQPDDLYRGKQWGITTEEWMKWQRTIAEAKQLGELAQITDPAHPTLALVDGSLVHWELEHLPEPARRFILESIWGVWEHLRGARIPLLGYISSPRASDGVNFLRLSGCPYPQPDCASYCAELAIEQLPCGGCYPMRDAQFWQAQLDMGEFSPLFCSCAPITQVYPPEHQIYFSYVQLGTDTARLEMPAWTALDPQLRHRAYRLVLAQIQKGYGYPIALAEAHNQAVVTSGDRQRFFAVLNVHLQRLGLGAQPLSAKATRKRRTVA
ncbi:MAG: DNA double-strand break repair nuclease NurA [Pseudanabaenaceae cyanobacterium]